MCIAFLLRPFDATGVGERDAEVYLFVFVMCGEFCVIGAGSGPFSLVQEVWFFYEYIWIIILVRACCLWV